MAAKSNFRTQYYNSLNRFSNSPLVVNEKSIIDSLLKENTYDVDKLRNYCSHFTLPAIHRIHVWKVILGILPPNKGSHEFCSKQRQLQFEDLYKCVCSTLKLDDSTPKPQAWYMMHQIEERKMPLDSEGLFESPEGKIFIAVAQAVSRLTDDLADQFWLSSKLYKHFCKFRPLIPQQVEKISSLLKQQDVNLWTTLERMGTLNSIPWEDWFHKAFAGVLPKTSFEKIWDKLMGDCHAILLNVAMAVFIVFRRPLLTCVVNERAIALLGEIPEDCGDSIVNTALDMCRDPVRSSSQE